MKRLILIISLGVNVTVFSQQWDWAKEIGPASDPQSSPLIRTNEAGELFTATTGQLPGTYAYHIKVSRYSVTGVLAWEKTWGGTNAPKNFVKDLALDAHMNTYVLGFFSGQLSFAGTTLNTGPDAWQIYIASYDARGEERWIRHFPVNPGWGSYLIADTENNVVFASADQAKGEWTLAKLTSQGELLWEKTYVSFASIARLRCNAHNAIYLAGEFYQDTLEINGKIYSTGNTNQFNSYLLALTERGEPQVPEIIPGGKIHDFGFDKNNNLYMIGAYDRVRVKQLSLVMTPCPYYYSWNCWEYFIAKIDVNDSCSWLRRIPRTFWTGWPGGFTVAPSGDFFLSGVLNRGGYTSSTLSLDGINVKNENAVQSLFVYKFNDKGIAQWGKCNSGTSNANSFPCNMAYSESNSLYLSGNYQSANSLHGAVLSFGNIELPEAGMEQRMFIARLANEPVNVMSNAWISEPENSWSIMPNPTEGKLSLTCTCSSAQPVCITVRNFLGQVIFSKRFSNVDGELNENLNLGDHPKGIYFVELQHEKRRLVKRVMLD